MTSIGKAAIAISTIGVVGGVGAYAGGLFSGVDNKEPEVVKISISKKLEKEGFTVLDTNKAGGDWTDVLAVYKKATDKTFSGKPENNKPEQELREKCREILNLENSEDYAKAKMWCVKKEKMDAIIKKAGFKVLTSAGDVAEGEQEKWNAKINKLINKNPKPFKELETKIKQGAEHLNDNVKALRDECEKIKIKDLDTTDAKFETNFDIAKEWCSVKETN